MKIYSATVTGRDGAAYNVRFLLEPAELLGLQRAGIVGEVAEVIGMQDVADSLIAGLEKQMHIAAGGQTQ